MSKKITRLRGLHGLETVIVLVVFLATNFCYGISYIKDKDATDSLISEINFANQIELEKVLVDMRLENGDGWTQGFTITNKYFIVVSTINDGNNVLTAYDKKTLKKVKEVHVDIGHGNDLAYNKNTNEIVSLSAPNNTIKFFDADTLEEMPDRAIELGNELLPSARANSITYSADYDKYYLFSPEKGGKVFDGDFAPLAMTFDTSSPFNLYQTASYHNGYLIYSRGCHVRRGECARMRENDLKEAAPNKSEQYAPSSSAIIIYNGATGAREEMFYIPPSDKNGLYYGEFEGASVDDNNDIYFLYASYMNGDLTSIGDTGTFVIFRLKKDSKMPGNKKLRKMLNVRKKSVLDANPAWLR